MKHLIYTAIVFAAVYFSPAHGDEAAETAGQEYIEKVDRDYADRCTKVATANWKFSTDVTDENKQELLDAMSVDAKATKKAWEQTITYDWKNFQNYTLKRMFEKYAKLGTPALSDEKHEELQNVLTSMQEHLSKTKICDFNDPSKCDVPLEPDLMQLFGTSDNPEELKHAWVEWHNLAGSPIKDRFQEYVKLSNEVAKANNYSNYAEYWLSDYEDDHFEQDVRNILDEMKPLYRQFHAYVRRKLWDKYGDSVLSRTGPIPAHLLGMPLGEAWFGVEQHTIPYPGKTSIDITSALVAKNYTAQKIAKSAEDFFQSLGLPAMPPSFWQNSIIERPENGREFDCQASAYDFFDGENFRIKACLRTSYEDFLTLHHEMGHIVQMISYKHLPAIFRQGPNAGFHEAIGDVIALSATSLKHFRKIGVLEDGEDNSETEINKLLSRALLNIAVLPYAFMLDAYRYAIFRGETTPEDYNCHFWALREELQGVEPPEDRDETQFDAGAKLHVADDTEFMRYFVSFVLQLHFYSALCQKAGEYDPNDSTKKLFDCDFYGNKEVGQVLDQMFKLGSSRPWPDAMEIVTGQRKMLASGLLDYFKTLHDWLKVKNEETGETLGWEPSKRKYCTEEQKAALATKKAVKQRKAKSLLLDVPAH